MRIPNIVVLLSSFLAAGSVPANEVPANFDTVTLERTPCFGACSAYIVEVKSSGDVRFVGKSDVKAKGEHHSNVSPGDIEFLRLAIRHANFYQLRDSYAKTSDGCAEVWTDNPSLTIRIASGASSKTVAYYFGCRGPLALFTISWLADTIDEIAGTSKWIGPRLIKDD